jgi:hypothetical protein
MKEAGNRIEFGYAGECSTFEEALALLRIVVGADAQSATTAFAMLLAVQAVEGGVYRQHALEVLDALAFAKAKLDSLMSHTYPTVRVTAEILSAAQQFANDNTVAATEWVTSHEVVAQVLSSARQYAEVKKWRKLVFNEQGAVIGTKDF